VGLSTPLSRSAPSILTWGLIGPGKGIEHGIAAVARLRKLGIDVEYVVSGATHPNVLADDGEAYRYQLLMLSRHLGVDDLVRFDGHYRSREEQDQIISDASIVLLPYDSHEQVTSGVLVEALAAGKPVIATRFPHALELEPSGGIEIVGHRCPDQIAEAILSIIDDPSRYDEMRSAAWMEGLRHDWSLVGPKFSRVMDGAIARGAKLDVRRQSTSRAKVAVA
jgi:glycosyltransferase involved in cell wall biosynthesis